jgi:hypothetical protein
MGTRNQVGIGLSYRPASLCNLATQFQTRFLESIPRPIAGLKIPTLKSGSEAHRTFVLPRSGWAEQRDRERRPYTPCGPASWTMGTDNLKLCTIGKKIFCTGPTGSADQFFMLPLPSKILRLNSVSTGNEPINIL